MGLYTIEKIRQVARSKDKRLEDTKKYPDSWIDEKIDNAFETAESGRQVFSNEEVIDLSSYVADGTEKLEISMDNEIHNYYSIQSTHTREIDVTLKNDNSLAIELDIEALKKKSEEISITCRYFYYPNSRFTEVFIKPEVYHYFRHCLYTSLYGALRDKESEMFHQEQVDRFIADGSFGIPNDFANDSVMNPNFDLQDRYV